ncbi:hypothetical protein EV424DRAFT_1342281 [Suillus variegatus]|nr:hypothetical protein EV424DRAFT_1342281 [Suillus variegatus]
MHNELEDIPHILDIDLEEYNEDDLYDRHDTTIEMWCHQATSDSENYKCKVKCESYKQEGACIYNLCHHISTLMKALSTMDTLAARSMGTPHRKECLDYQMNDCNFMKMIRMMTINFDMLILEWPTVVLDRFGIIVLWYLPGAIDEAIKTIWVKVSAELSPRKGNGARTRAVFKPVNMALLRVASIYLWDGFCKVIRYAPKFHPEVLATLKQDGPALCQAIQQPVVLAAAALRVMHGGCYWSSLTTQLGLGLWADNNQLQEMGNCLREWASSFTVLAVMCNRHSPLHRDSQSLAQWFDIMTSIGNYGPIGAQQICAVSPSCRTLGFVMWAYQFLTYQAWAHHCKGYRSQACGCLHISMWRYIWVRPGCINCGSVMGPTGCVFHFLTTHNITGESIPVIPKPVGPLKTVEESLFCFTSGPPVSTRWVGPYHLAEMSRWVGHDTTGSEIPEDRKYQYEKRYHDGGRARINGGRMRLEERPPGSGWVPFPPGYTFDAEGSHEDKDPFR